MPEPVSGAKKVTGASSEPSNEALDGADASALVIVGTDGELDLPGNVLGVGPIKRTLEGASNLAVTVFDPDLSVLNDPVLRRHEDGFYYGALSFGGLDWQVAGVSLLENHQVEIVFEAQAVWKLRRFSKEFTFRRGAMTRAEVEQWMCKQAGVQFESLELETKQPTRSPPKEEPETRAEKDQARKPGFASGAKVIVKGENASAQKRADIEVALEQAIALKAPKLATEALIVAGIGESNFDRNAVAHSINGAQVGIWQSDIIPADQVAKQAHYFLMGGESFQAGGAIKLANEGKQPGEIATLVEASGEPAAFYGRYESEARAIILVYAGGEPSILSASHELTVTVAKKYLFTNRKNKSTGALENYWECARRLAEEVNWYLWEEGGVIHYQQWDGPDGLKISRARMLVAPGADGLLGNPTFNLMASEKHEDTVTVNCEARIWQAPPGSIVEVEGYGDADGRWPVGTIERPNLKSAKTIVTLVRGKPAKKEPAPETESKTVTGGRSTALAAYEAAELLSRLKLGYPLGDVGDTGHAPHELANVEHNNVKGTVPNLDCSSSVSWVLYKSGMWVENGATAETTFGLINWGESGEGKEMTVWVSNSPGQEHTFIEFKIPGKPHMRLDTVPGVGEENGPRLRPFSPLPEGSSPTAAGFTARRYPGK